MCMTIDACVTCKHDGYTTKNKDLPRQRRRKSKQPNEIQECRVTSALDLCASIKSEIQELIN